MLRHLKDKKTLREILVKAIESEHGIELPLSRDRNYNIVKLNELINTLVTMVVVAITEP